MAWNPYDARRMPLDHLAHSLELAREYVAMFEGEFRRRGEPIPRRRVTHKQRRRKRTNLTVRRFEVLDV